MDEGTLNDLLECSICLERLDTSSKVLPCQHTFCKKCLDEIVHKHKELRCPECRILVQIKVEDLPPNVLLMRILEGMKSAGHVLQKKVNRGNRGLFSTTQQIPVLQSNMFHQGTDHSSITNKQQNLALVSHQPYAKAVYDYASKEAGDLSFKRGEIIILKKRIDSHWYQGECGGKQGVFPLSYVQIITPVPSHLPQCKALYDFRMTNDEEEGCLAFSKGDIINVIRRVDENWAEGKLDGRIGIFPLAFVEMNNLARSLMKLSSNAQPGPSRVAPPTPTLDDSTPLIPTDHTRIVQHQSTQNSQPSSATPDSGDSTPSTVSSDSSSTPNLSSSNTSSGTSTAPSSPASPPHIKSQPLPPRNSAQRPDISPKQIKQCSTPQRSPQVQSTHSLLERQINNHHAKEKRHSFTGLPKAPQSATTHNRHSAEILTSDEHVTCNTTSQISERSIRSAPARAVPIHDIQLPTTYVALYPYKPQKSDELELKKGSIYIVTERCQDGWFKGTSNRTLKCGVFPGNYVTLARGVPNQSGGFGKDGLNESKVPVSYTRSGKTVMPSGHPPELPPRSTSPLNLISSSWHGQQHHTALPMGRSNSAIMSGVTAQQVNLNTGHAKTSDKNKERKEKSSVSLMKRLASMKRSKSPLPSTYSMDNPVFEDSSVNATKSPAHPVHVRSGSCPSQLLQIQHSDPHHILGSSSQRHKHKERSTILTHNSRTIGTVSSGSSPEINFHRKSSSLDAGNKSKTGVQTVRERFRCITPYPPNSEYELELQVNDIIYVHKKRDDGWYKGTQQRTGKTGLFPASFVESY